jgi:hypothetical protein
LRALPQHAVAHHGLAFFAARVADDFAPIGRFNPNVATVARDHQAGVQRCGVSHCVARSRCCHPRVRPP